MSQIREKLVTDERMDGRTTKVYLNDLPGRSKNVAPVSRYARKTILRRFQPFPMIFEQFRM